MESERERIEAVARNHPVLGSGISCLLMDFRFDSLRRYIPKDASVAEIGSGEGYMTGKLQELTEDLTVFDGSREYLSSVKKKNPSVKIKHTLFEELRSERKFDVILCCQVLEHVENPEEVLKNIKRLCHDRSLVLLTVPNAFSFHRLLGVEMGLLRRPDELNDRDLKIGHRRVYNKELLTQHISSVGFRIKERKGIFLKPINDAILAEFSEEQLHGLHGLGEKFPDYCADLFFILTV